MKKIVITALLASQTCLAADALAKDQVPGNFTIQINGIENGKPIPGKFAYCMPDGKGHTKDGGNVSPSIDWHNAPAGTKSFALIVVDPDVPNDFSTANKQGQTIPDDFPRQNFYHWVLVDIPTSVTGLLQGKDSNGITPGGKPFGKTEYGLNGQNDYATAGMGQGGGYDGPCPPWNDERLHHYHFIVYALDIPTLGLPSPVHGKQAESVMAGHVLAKAEVVGTYRDNLLVRRAQ